MGPARNTILARPSALTAIAVVVSALGGCGDLGSGNEVTEAVELAPEVTERQVERQPEGSPERVFLEWWRALQFRAPALAARYYSVRLGVTTAQANRWLRVPGPALGLNQRPRVVGVQEDGNRATVLTLLEKSKRQPNGRVDTEHKAQGFNLIREDGDWKLADNMYLRRYVRQYREFTAPLRERGEAPDSP